MPDKNLAGSGLTNLPAAFFSEDGGRDIQKSLIEYVSHFVTIAAGKRFNPHVTIGVGTETYLNNLLAEPFDSFSFSPIGAAVYHLTFQFADGNSFTYAKLL